MPWADKLYGCDTRWWNYHKGVPDFPGEKWSTHQKDAAANDKAQVAEDYGVNLVRGERAQFAGFSTDPGCIFYGDNSGFQAINLAVLLGSPYIVLVGYDMSAKGKGHFFGKHPDGLHNQDNYERWVPEFDAAAAKLDGVKIINATPDSALTSFETAQLEDAIAGWGAHKLLIQGS